MLTLYDLALADQAIRPSPYCWMVKFALLHKGLEFETVPVGFADKSKYPDPGYGRVPAIVSGADVLTDSQVIMAWLDRSYPEKPLANTPAEYAAAEFHRAWVLSAFYPAVAPLVVTRIHALAAEEDKDYFRKTREARFGKTLEEVAALPGSKEKTEAALQPLAAPLGAHDFLGGKSPNLSDYIVMGALMWPRCVTAADIFAAPAPVAAWTERLLDLFGGYARETKRPR